MTTREIYFKILTGTDLPVCLVGYVYKDDCGIIQIGKNIPINFSVDNNIANDNIKKMKEIENIDGFMFWVNSPEGENFINDNSNALSNVMSKIILKSN